MESPQREQPLSYNAEAQPYESGDAEAETYTQLTNLPAPPFLDSHLNCLFSSQHWLPRWRGEIQQPSRQLAALCKYLTGHLHEQRSQSWTHSSEEKQAGVAAALGKGSMNTTKYTQLLYSSTLLCATWPAWSLLRRAQHSTPANQGRGGEGCRVSCSSGTALQLCIS